MTCPCIYHLLYSERLNCGVIESPEHSHGWPGTMTSSPCSKEISRSQQVSWRALLTPMAHAGTQMKGGGSPPVENYLKKTRTNIPIATIRTFVWACCYRLPVYAAVEHGVAAVVAALSLFRSDLRWLWRGCSAQRWSKSGLGRWRSPGSRKPMEYRRHRLRGSRCGRRRRRWRRMEGSSIRCRRRSRRSRSRRRSIRSCSSAVQRWSKDCIKYLMSHLHIHGRFNIILTRLVSLLLLVGVGSWV